MATTLAPNSSITDVTLTVIFTPCQPLGVTTVILEPDPGADHTGLLSLLEAAIERLLVYRADYADALAADALSTTERTF
jgi:hypothetical protein